MQQLPFLDNSVILYGSGLALTMLDLQMFRSFCGLLCLWYRMPAFFCLKFELTMKSCLFFGTEEMSSGYLGFKAIEVVVGWVLAWTFIVEVAHLSDSLPSLLTSQLELRSFVTVTFELFFNFWTLSGLFIIVFFWLLLTLDVIGRWLIFVKLFFVKLFLPCPKLYNSLFYLGFPVLWIFFFAEMLQSCYFLRKRIDLLTDHECLPSLLRL